MKTLYTALAILFFTTSFSQVGINTVSPQTDLHISKSAADGGTIQIDGGIRLGGNDTTPGNIGKDGQVLMSTGGSAEWVTLGTAGGYVTDCEVPNKIATIVFTLPDGSNGNVINVTSAQITTALNSLPDGGIIVLRTNSVTTYNNSTTRLTVQLPSALSVLNKPFVLAFDGPSNSNNLINHNKTIEILVKASESNSLVYELGTTSTNRKFTIDDFPNNANSDYKVSELDNNSGATQPIILFNSYTIKAISDKSWSFTTRDCYIQNPTF